MPSPVAMLRRQDFERPSIDTSDMPKIDLSKLEMPKMDLTKVDLSKVDVPKAFSDAAVAVGLAKRPRSRWPFALGAVLVVTAAGIALMNTDAIAERIRQARRWIADRMDGMNTGLMQDEAVAFPAAETMPIEPPAFDPTPASKPSDYPEGLGGSPESITANGRSKATSAR
jgi:hypothetical protein